ncbi:MAG: YfhO family protein [Candidatus Thiodiazotropha endolucinida]|nr:YfhO family protein [Candidatus Thiodiazotropha taylori]MCW4265616.1 YfhO family protein [Candidatus Thiodiazotropha endolucinida]
MGTELLTETAPCSLQRDSVEAYFRCRFPSQILLDKGSYELEVLVEGESASASLSAVVYPSNSPLLQLQVGNRLSERVLGLRGYRRTNAYIYRKVLSGDNDSYIVRELEPGVVLVENRLVNGSAYFISSLSGISDAQYDQLRLKTYSDTSMQFEYIGDESGWVVIPVRMYPGWSCLVNGKKVEPALFNGVMPTVPVRGNSRVDFIYSPTHYAVPAAVSILGVLLGLLLSFKAQSINRWLTDHYKTN